MTIAVSTEEIHADRAGFQPETDPGPVAMTTAATIGAALLDLADSDPDRPLAYVEGSGDPVRLTAAELAERAGAAATTLAEHGVRRGDRVGVCMDTSADAYATLHGCFLLGAIPFVSEPPLATMRRQRWADRLRLLISRAEPRAVVVAPEFLDAVTEPCKEAGVAIVEPPFEGGLDLAAAQAKPDDIALLQFTSGTTGDSRGVTLTHESIFANAAAIGEHAYRAGDLIVSWLPMHHDMGLIGLNLAPLLHGLPVASMPPLSFAVRPERWLWAMHRYRGTFTSAPNFAYRMCASNIPDAKLAGLDLSAWRVAGNGAEVVQANTLRLFAERMAPYGYGERSMMPCYGMAEITLAATMCVPGEPLTTLTVSRDRLAADGEVVEAEPGAADAQELVSSGTPLTGMELRVVDDAGADLPDRKQGTILLRTASMMSGYYRQPEETAKVLGEDGWLNTGDQGFTDAGQTYVTGRIKDVVIIAGSNYHPYAFESAAAAVEGLRANSIAAVGCPDEERSTEALVLVVESKSHADAEAVAQIREGVIQAVSAETGLRPDRVEVVPRGTLPKTPSGKLQRRHVVDALVSGTLPTSH
ncbi:fatty acyl-AMP ligase [Streptomyces sp. NPDC004134]|uniref:fatty acyl-AMP ligase n=1 Tax=Streptomyces sp. NPDC004134 TaxID=3364691 RepID=UPI0036A52CFC